MSVNGSIDDERKDMGLWMRHILSETVGKHVVFISLVTKMLNPLHLVATVVNETLIEEGEVLPFLDHHIGLE